MKRQFDKIISKGTGSQLLWLTVLCALLFCLFFAIGTVVYGDLPWQEVTALLLDPGCFGGEGHHDVFRLLIALAGCFTFSALLVSVFSNIIDNLSDDWHKGNVRYRCHDHIVILGAHRHLLSMLREADRLPDGNIVIMTSGDVEYSRIVVSEENDEKSLRTLLHLPARFHNVKKVIYQEQCADLLKLARQTGKYGMIASFGSGVGKADAMFFNRMGYGKVVNRFYDQQYNKPQAQDAESAWYKIPEAHKLSSIYCAMALPLRLECISADDDVMAVCEVEHRRWMMSCLLMGYMPFSLSESRRVRADKQRFKEEKRHYRHADIAPFSSLDDFEKRKDLLFVEHTREIINVERTKIDWHIKPEPSCL